jgi:tetratricopeptide (TPR) repeat protein
MGAVMGFIPLRSQYEYYSEQWRLLDERFRHPGYFVSSAISLATVQSGIGDWDALRRRLEKVIEICNEMGDKRQAGEAYSFLSSIAIIEGDIRTAAENANRMLDHALKASNPIHFVWGCQWLGSVAIQRGKYEDAFAWAARARERTEKDSVGEVDNQTMDAIFAHAQWLTGAREESVRIAREICDKAAKASIVDYSIYIAYIHMTEVLFLDMERAWKEEVPAAEKEETLKYARQCTKIWKKYMPIFTVGAPAFYRFTGLVEWYEDKPEKAHVSWRRAVEKAHTFPMRFEEARAWLELGRHLPNEHPERDTALEHARRLFSELELENWVSTVDSETSN